MDSKEHMPSVIARLMDLDELSPKQPVQKRQRVLSEKYLYRVASLGVREKFQPYKYLSRKNSDAVKEHKDVVAAGTQNRGNFCNQWDQKREANSGAIGIKNEFKGLKYADSRSQDDSHSSLRNSHKLRKLNVTKNLHAPSLSQARKKTILKSTGASFCQNSDRCRNAGEKSELIKSPQFSRYRLYSKERVLLSPRRLSNGNTKFSNTSHIPDAAYKDKYFGLPRFRPFSAYPTISQGHRRGRNIVPNSYSNMQHEDFVTRNVTPELEMQYDRQNNCLVSNRLWSSGDASQFYKHFDTKNYHSSSGDRQCKINKLEDICEKIPVASVSLFKSSYFMKDDDSSSQSADDSFLQDTSNVYSEEGSGLSHYSSTDRDSLKSLEGYQPSPDSVLERYFTDDRVTRTQCLWGVSADPYGLKMHLDLLKSDLSEAYSEGSEVNVSSEEDNGEESIFCSEENRDILRSFNSEESRDFSYLVDILGEASFLEKELDQAYSEWHMADCPISLHVFETLEKKYGEQTCWKRSDRRLLFDHINLGLVEIFMPCMGVPSWTKPVSKRLPGQCKEAIEDKLWTFLLKQEKEAHDALPNEVVAEFDRWLDLGAYVDMIVLDLEAHLVEELAAEVVSIEKF